MLYLTMCEKWIKYLHININYLCTYRLVPISQGPKNSGIPGPNPLPLPHVMYEVHPKSKWKMWIKREWLQLGGNFFLEFLKASIADLITLFFSWLQNSEGGGDSDSGDSFADPCQFLPFPKTKIQLSASLRPLAKNLQKQKLLLGSMWRKSKQKNWKKAFKSAAVKRQRFFTKIWFFDGFLASVEALLKCFE